MKQVIIGIKTSKDRLISRAKGFETNGYEENVQDTAWRDKEMKNQSLGEIEAAVRQPNSLALEQERIGRMKERRYLKRYA